MDTKSTIDDHPLVIELLKERYQKAEKEIYRVVEEFNLIMYEKPDKTVSAVFCSYFENLLEVLKTNLMTYNPLSFGQREISVKRYNKDANTLYEKLTFSHQGAHKSAITTLLSFPVTDGHKLISGSKDKSIKIWKDDFTCEETLKVHTGDITSLLYFIEKGKGRLATADSLGEVKIWYPGNWKEKDSFKVSKGVRIMEYIPLFEDSPVLAISLEKVKEFELWAMKGKVGSQQYKKIARFDVEVETFLYLKDHNLLAISQKEEEGEFECDFRFMGENSSNEFDENEWEKDDKTEKNVCFLNCQTGKFEGNFFLKIKFTPISLVSVPQKDKKSQLIAANQDTICLWDVEKADLILEKNNIGLKDHDLKQMVYLYDSLVAASYIYKDSLATIIIFDYLKQCVAVKRFSNLQGAVSNFSYIPRNSPLCSYFVIGSSTTNEVKYIDIDSRNIVSTNSKKIITYTFDEQSREAILGFENGSIQIWKFINERKFALQNQLQQSNIVTSISKIEIEKRNFLITSDDSKAYLWDVKSKQLFASFNLCLTGIDYLKIYRIEDKLYSVAKSNVNKKIVVKLQNAYDLNIPELREKHDSWENCMIYVPPSENVHKLPLIVSGSFDEKVKVFRADTMECVFTMGSHRSGVDSLAYCPPGDNARKAPIVASGGRDNEIKLWDLNSGELIRVLTGHRDSVTSLLYIPASQNAYKIPLLASSNKSIMDQKIRIYNIDSGELVFTVTGSDKLSFIPNYDGKQKFPMLVNCSSFDDINIWDLDNCKLTKLEEHHRGWMTMPICVPASDTKFNIPLLVTGGEDNKVSLSHCRIKLEGHTKSVNCLAYIPPSDNKHKAPIIVSGSDDNTVRGWNIDTQNCLCILKEHNGGVICLLYIPSDKNRSIAAPLIISADTEGVIRVWEMENYQKLFIFTGNKCRIHTLIYIPPTDNLLNIPLLVGSESSIKAWNFEKAYKNKIIKSHKSSINALVYVPPFENAQNVQLIVSSSYDKTIKGWDVTTGDCLFCFKEHSEPATYITCIPYTDNEFKALLVAAAYGKEDSSIKIWNTINGECIHTLSGHYDNVYSMLYIPSHDQERKVPLLITAGKDSKINFWNINNGECVNTINENSRGREKLIYIPENQNSLSFPLLVSIHYDNNIKLWNLNDFTNFSKFDTKQSSSIITFIPAKNNSFNLPLLATGGAYGRLNFWNIIDGRCLFTKEFRNNIQSIVYIPQNDTHHKCPLVVTGDGGVHLRVTNAQTGEEVFTLEGHKSGNTVLIYSPPNDNKYCLPLLISGNNDDAVYMWDLNNGRIKNTFLFDEKVITRRLLCLPAAHNHLHLPILVVSQNSDIHINYMNKEELVCHQLDNNLLEDTKIFPYEDYGFIFSNEIDQFKIFDIALMKSIKDFPKVFPLGYFDLLAIDENSKALVLASDKYEAFALLEYPELNIQNVKSFRTECKIKVVCANIFQYYHKKILFVGFEDGSIITFDYHSAQIIKTMHRHLHPITSLSGFNFGKFEFFVSGDRDGVCKIFNIEGNLCFEPPLEDEKLRQISMIEKEGKQYMIQFYESSIRISIIVYSKITKSRSGYQNFMIHGMVN